MNIFTYSNLCSTLTEWARLYESGTSPVSDVVYDTEYRKLKEFEKANPDLISPLSPTQIIIGSLDKDGESVEHKHKMLSIANLNSSEELIAWLSDKYSKGIKSVLLEYKIDGMSLSLLYKNGRLYDAITRGDTVGDVSIGQRAIGNATQVASIIKHIPNFTGEIRGETVWFKSKFDDYNRKMSYLGKKQMANCRNGATGTMKSKDPKEVKERSLDFIAYRMLDGSANDLHHEDLNQMREFGFYTSDYFLFDLIPANYQKIVDTVAKMNELRADLPYITDGLVIKVDDKREYSRLGGSSKAPHAFGAYKFPPEVKSSPVLSIEESAGKTGAVTPVANVVPVSLSGTSVKRSTVHNWDLFEYMGFYPGCSVNIRKSGEIIPEILSVVGIEGHSKDDYEKLVAKYGRNAVAAEIKSLRLQYPSIQFSSRPTVCNHCGTTLSQDVGVDGSDLVALVCPNGNCSSRQLKSIEAFVSKECMNIMHIGEATVHVLFDTGLVKDIRDFYHLNKQNLSSVMGDREAERCLESIEASKKNHLNQLLNSFCIDNVGKGTSDRLSDAFGTLSSVNNAILNASATVLAIPDIGEGVCSSLVEWFTKNSAIVDFFIAENIACNAKEKIIKGNALAGKLCIMTGSSELVGRDQFKKIVVEQGGKISSSITGKTDLVLVGSEAGPLKLRKIADLRAAGSNIRVVSDSEFLEIVGI